MSTGWAPSSTASSHSIASSISDESDQNYLTENLLAPRFGTRHQSSTASTFSRSTSTREPPTDPPVYTPVQLPNPSQYPTQPPSDPFAQLTINPSSQAPSQYPAQPYLGRASSTTSSQPERLSRREPATQQSTANPAQPSVNPRVRASAQPAAQQRQQHRTPQQYGGSHRLIIAIDYGTTFTGVAFATPASNQVRLDEIEVVDNWGPKMDNSVKVPSIYSYTPPTNADEEQWGASISDNAVTMEHTKLELDIQDTKADELELILQVLNGTGNLSFESVMNSRGLPEYTWKNPEDIVTDYLTKIFRNVRTAFENYGSLLRAQLPVDIVITIPVNWSYQAKNSTLKAVLKAGFNSATFPNLKDIMLVSEPEAAAIFTARHLKEEQHQRFLRVGECFVLCDAGGGTVDLVAYRVTQLEPTLELEQMTRPTSAKCGSTFIDSTFKRWLYSAIGEGNFLALESRSAGEQIGAHTVRRKRMRQLIKRFEVRKKMFSNSLTGQTFHVDLPDPLHTLNLPGRVNGGELMIAFEEMKKLFDPCVDRVVEMIQAQIHQVERKGSRVQNVFLVGGFGESPYLREELARSLLIRKIAIRQPVSLKSWTAVVQGACIYGVEKNNRRKLPTVILSAKSIAIALNERFDAQKNSREDRYQDEITNMDMAMGQLHWLVRRGDLLVTGVAKKMEKRITFAFLRNSERIAQVPIYLYAHPEDDVPDQLRTGRNDLKQIESLKCNLSHIPSSRFERVQGADGRKTYFIAELVCKIVLAGTTLTFDVRHKGQHVCKAVIPNMAGPAGPTNFDVTGDGYHSDDFA